MLLNDVLLFVRSTLTHNSFLCIFTLCVHLHQIDSTVNPFFTFWMVWKQAAAIKTPSFSSSYDMISASLTWTWIWSAAGSQNNPSTRGLHLHLIAFLWLVQVTLSMSPVLRVCLLVLCINSSLVQTYILNVFCRGLVWILSICYKHILSVVSDRFLCGDIILYGQIFHHNFSFAIFHRRQEGNKYQ